MEAKVDGDFDGHVAKDKEIGRGRWEMGGNGGDGMMEATDRVARWLWCLWSIL